MAFSFPGAPGETTMSDATDQPARTIGDELNEFIHGIDSLQMTFPIMVATVSVVTVACSKDALDFLEARGMKIPQSATDPPLQLDQEDRLEFDRLISRVHKTQAGAAIIPEHFVVALVSQYDAFLGELLRILYRAKPDRMRESKKTFTYAELHDFADINAIKEHMLEKRIEKVLRSNHTAQFDLMERQFMDVKKKDGETKQGTLRKGLPIWSEFIELTERRNLLVHCRGHVSQQYLDVCDAHKVDFSPRPKLGERLGVTADYFARAHACIYELGVKLAHVLWRKVLPEERLAADERLAKLTYDLLVADRCQMAITLGRFATGETIKEWANDHVKRRLIVNLAQAYKWEGQQDKVEAILGDHDWSACSPEFQQAVAVLRDDYPLAIAKMRQIGPKGFPSASDYRDWPLFKQIRKTDEFAQAYREVFGRPFEPLSPNDVYKSFADQTWGMLRGFLQKDAKPDEPATVAEQPALQGQSHGAAVT